MKENSDFVDIEGESCPISALNMYKKSTGKNGVWRGSFTLGFIKFVSKLTYR